MLRELVNPSSARTPVVDDLHVGIVTTDMGSGLYQISTCEGPPEGDGGMLRSAGALSGCQATYGAADCERAEWPDGAASCTGSTFPDGLQGWFYTTASASCELGEIRLTGAGVTDQAVELRLECLVEP
jgi:hypothetical protein